MPTLLITRPQPEGTAFLAEVEAGLGREVPHLLAPLSVIEPLGAEVPGAGALIFTSGRAVAQAGDLSGRLAFCVGDKTALLARAAGAEAISAAPGGGDVEALLALILRESPGPLTHMRGEDSAGDLVARLRANGILAGERIAYRARRLALSAPARALLASGAPVLAPVFSPRAARFLAEEAPELPATVIAISAAAARPFAGRAAQRACNLVIAAAPDGPAMLDAVLRQLGNLS